MVGIARCNGCEITALLREITIAFAVIPAAHGCRSFRACYAVALVPIVIVLALPLDIAFAFGFLVVPLARIRGVFGALDNVTTRCGRNILASCRKLTITCLGIIIPFATVFVVFGAIELLTSLLISNLIASFRSLAFAFLVVLVPFAIEARVFWTRRILAPGFIRDVFTIHGLWNIMALALVVFPLALAIGVLGALCIITNMLEFVIATMRDFIIVRFA